MNIREMETKLETKSINICSQTFTCELCDYKCSKKCNYDKHLLTSKHKMKTTGNKKYNEKVADIFFCNDCHYSCSVKCNYDKHLLSLKHKNRKNHSYAVEKVSVKSSQTKHDNIGLQCSECKKIFKTRAGVWKHMKKCDVTDDVDTEIIHDADIQQYLQKNVIELLENQVIQQTEIIKQKDELIKQKDELIKQKDNLIECKSNTRPQYINNTTNNFNLNIFLNTTCKDAMNINEFIETINVKVSDLDYIGKEGYIEGISRVIIQGLNELEITRRPIHCTDIKRKSLYLKDNDTWNKESSNMGNMKKMINSVQNKNVRTIPAWQEANPSSKTCLSPKNMEYVTIVNKVMGGSTDDEDEQNYRGIINKVTNAVLIDKHELSAIGELEISVMQDQRDESDAVMQNTNE